MISPYVKWLLQQAWPKDNPDNELKTSIFNDVMSRDMSEIMEGFTGWPNCKLRREIAAMFVGWQASGTSSSSSSGIKWHPDETQIRKEPAAKKSNRANLTPSKPNKSNSKPETRKEQ
jgi:hypothetical protein